MIPQKVQQYTGLVPRTELEIDDNDIRIAICRQEAIGWHNFLLGHTARQFEAIHVTATWQWNSAPFWAKNLILALWELSWTIWKYRNETLHDRTGVDGIPTRELNDSVTQEWQNGDTKLLPQDKALIQGTSLPQLLQTSQEHKLAWLAKIRLARLAFTSTQDGDESTDIESETSETTQDLWTMLCVQQPTPWRNIIIKTTQQEQAISLHSSCLCYGYLIKGARVTDRRAGRWATDRQADHRDGGNGIYAILFETTL
jgi:hypothetical protein